MNADDCGRLLSVRLTVTQRVAGSAGAKKPTADETRLRHDWRSWLLPSDWSRGSIAAGCGRGFTCSLPNWPL